LLERHLLERCIALQPGIADDDMQRSHVLDRLRKHGEHLVFLTDIGFDRHAAAAHRFDRVGDFLGFLWSGDVVDHNVRPGRRQPQGDRFADAGIRAGDKCRLAGQHIRVGKLRKWSGARRGRSGRSDVVDGARSRHRSAIG
jgi:hypothetical protein